MPPLLGYLQFPGLEVALKNALFDLRALEQGGVDGIIFENNYDIPHTVLAEPGTLACMALIGKELRDATRLPLGVSVLWNDFKGAFSLARLLDLQFIRIPVFVDTVQTSYGIVKGEPMEVQRARKLLGTEHVALFTDIHVKHSKLLSKNGLVDSAKLAKAQGSHAAIITGKWTGVAPHVKELEALRQALDTFPILVGSGADLNNVQALLGFANGVIVSTALKEGKAKEGEVNVKPYSSRIQQGKVEDFMRKIRN